MEELRADMAKIFKETGGDRLRQLAANSDDPKDKSLVDNIEKAVTEYISSFLERFEKMEERMTRSDEKVDKLVEIVENMHLSWLGERKKG